MPRNVRRFAVQLLMSLAVMGQDPQASDHASDPSQQKALTWQAAKDEFRTANPTLLANGLSVNEARAQEMTAFLRPNPDAGLGWDQLNLFSTSPYRPFSQSYIYGNLSYLHERDHKRELRLKSAQEGTAIAIASRDDSERNLLFSLRDAFIRVLQAKSILSLTKENLGYYDKLLKINRDRYEAGAIAHVDLQRIELQRVQYESDLATANVNVRTSKIDLLQLLNNRTPVDNFDVSGEFDFNDTVPPLEQLHNEALSSRPDLKNAQLTLEQARTNYKLAISNGSTDPTFGFDISHQPSPLNTYIGISVNIPLRIFDRNQGEKARTNIEIGRSQKLLDANQIAVLHDVDSAVASVDSTLGLLNLYRDKYLQEAADIRDTISYSYEHGAASLLDFLNAQSDYRTTKLAYLNLVGSYKSASNQLNLAVGREVLK